MKKAEFIARYGEEAYQRKLEKGRQWRENNPEYHKQYQQDNKEKFVEYQKQYYQANKEKFAQYYKDNKDMITEMAKQYRQANKEKFVEYQKQYQQTHKEEITEYQKKWREANKEKTNIYQRQYGKTKYGRAIKLYYNYCFSDEKYNRGECTLTPDYIIEHIFPNGCLYCGERDWRKLGCDRIDNSKPHTPDNVVCCCADCNKKRQKKGFDKFLNMSWRKRFS